jgi:uncharacterized protein YbjT (DUF2867 family)
MKIAVAGGTGTVGRYVVEEGRGAGHEMVVLSRSAGIDLRDEASGPALRRALEGVDVVVDTTDPHTLARRSATAFFESATRRLQAAGSASGARHLVTLSIVGIDRVPGWGYYVAKRRQEEVAREGPMPVTVVRATQFHEFAGEILRTTRRGPVAFMISMRTQPVAARTVGRLLVETATRPVDPTGRTLEIAGPDVHGLADLARRFLRQKGTRAVVVPLFVPGAAGRALRSGALLPGPEVPLGGPTFDQWLASEEDAAMFPA